MLPFREFYNNILEWSRQGRTKEIQISAGKRLEALGLIDLGIGSYWRWMHKPWFDRAINENILRKNIYNMWIPVAETEVIDKVVGKRGTMPIIEKVKSLNLNRFLNFAEDYERYLSNQYQASVKFSVETDAMRGELLR